MDSSFNPTVLIGADHVVSATVNKAGLLLCFPLGAHWPALLASVSFYLKTCLWSGVCARVQWPPRGREEPGPPVAEDRAGGGEEEEEKTLAGGASAWAV